ncbi:hypothetical protein HMPREF9440_00168 [Sutterella parvirubra YIT 11816]|uniref:Uncharacterized protein n=1 Tax=Sutterella parvirubra YIT 11816 TaxID=762967 RepID=H3KBS2_9BURK|nr:hypothetical protein HMPREF9440_00168 [Sutterella parvirubra YIT 11816]
MTGGRPPGASRSGSAARRGRTPIASIENGRSGAAETSAANRERRPPGGTVGRAGGLPRAKARRQEKARTEELGRAGKVPVKAPGRRPKNFDRPDDGLRRNGGGRSAVGW